MRRDGSIRLRAPGRFTLIFDANASLDPVTGKRPRNQQHVLFEAPPGTPIQQRQAAERKLAELIGNVQRDTYLEPVKTTLLDYLRYWLENSVRPLKRPATYKCYRSIIETHVAHHPVGNQPIQTVRSSNLEALLASVGGKASSLQVLVAVLRRALGRAVKDRLIPVTPAVDLEYRRPSKDVAAGVRQKCWSFDETRRFLAEARTASPQTAAFMFLALDSGARKMELAGLLWSDLDWDTGKLTISRQLDSAGEPPECRPEFGPIKNGKERTIYIGPETLAMLRPHRTAQLQIQMANRDWAVDHGLMFAREPDDCTTPGTKVGQAISALAERRFRRLIAAAGVRPIPPHGMRHTCASLLLAEGVQPKTVADRLGHDVMMLMRVYAHVLGGQQEEAAARLDARLHQR